MPTIPRWHTLRTAADWQVVAEAMMNEAIETTRANDTDAMSAVCDALGLFIQKRSTKCPQETVDAVFGAHSVLTRLIAGEIVGSISDRTVQLRAYLNDVQEITERVERQARMISLEPVIQLATDAEKAITDLKALKRAIADGESAGDLKAKVQELIDSLSTAVRNVKSNLPDDDNG